MGNSAIEYLKLLQHLLPKGKIWNRDQDSGLGEFLQGSADELSRAEARAYDLWTESLPTRINELIENYEEEYGLPEFGEELPVNLTDRKNKVIAKIVARGGQHKQYFIDVAASIGYTITITEYTPAWAGVAVAGDPCGEQTNIFYWRITVAGTWSDIDDLIARINQYKPAHTIVLYTFTT